MLLATALSFVVGQSGLGQPSRSWTFDAAVGGSHGHGGDFIDKGGFDARLATSAVVAHGRTGLYAEISYDWLQIVMADDLVCYVSPRGGCRQGYPEFSGPALSIGALAQPTSRTELRGSIGGAAYAANDTRIGAIVAAADATVYPTHHVGIVTEFRLAAVPRYRGDRLSIRAISVGIRLR